MQGIQYWEVILMASVWQNSSPQLSGWGKTVSEYCQKPYCSCCHEKSSWRTFEEWEGCFFKSVCCLKKKVLLRLPEGLHPLFPVNTFTLLFTDTKTEEVWQPMETWSSPALKIYIQYAFEAFPWLQLWKLIISLPLPPNSPITWIFWCLILDKLILPYSLKEHLPLPNCSTFRKACSSLQSPNAAAEIGSSITRTNNEKHFCFLWESTVTES